MNLNFIIDNQTRIKRIILSIIFILISIVIVSFFYHEILFKNVRKPKNIIDLSTDQKYISYNQDYINTLVEIKNYDDENFLLSLKDNFNQYNITWQYSIDNGVNWITSTDKEVLIEKQILKDNKTEFILITIKNNSLNEENNFKLELPSTPISNVAISYSTLDQTAKSVTATIISTSSNIMVMNNDNKDYYTFNENGSFTFEYIDDFGNKGEVTAKVDWIIEQPEIAEIIYDIPSITNQPVTAKIHSKKNITITNNRGKDTYTFNENGEFTFEYKDEDGNNYSTTAVVNWIDKIPPRAKISYDITDKTSEEVTATLTNENENILIINNEGLNTYTFKENGKFTFIFQDEAGNSSHLTASVTWIQKKETENTNENLSNNYVSNEKDSYLSKDAMSKTTILKDKKVSVKVPTYIIKEPLSLKAKSISLKEDVKTTLGNRLDAISLSLENSNKSTSLVSNMKVSFELDPDKNFLGIYKMNSEADFEELYYKKTDKNHIELEVQNLGNYVLSYTKKNVTPVKIKHTFSDLQVIILFTASIATLTGGITFFKKSRNN